MSTQGRGKVKAKSVMSQVAALERLVRTLPRVVGEAHTDQEWGRRQAKAATKGWRTRLAERGARKGFLE